MQIAQIIATAAATGVALANAAAIKPLVLGGTEVPVGEKTWMVGLKDDYGTISRCGGMLITPKHVLSAGHCPPFGYAQIGTHFKLNGTDGEQIKIVGEVIHPSYFEPDDNSVTWDYKIIELETASTIAPVPILSNDPTLPPFPGKFATSIGWGNTVEEFNGTHISASNVLLRVDLELRDQATCASMGITPLDETMVCAGGVVGQDTCNGDSGGPLFLETSKGDALIGIVSWGFGCGHEQPGVYSRLSTVLDWIKANAPGAQFVDYPDN